jgi:hypothetical protein
MAVRDFPWLGSVAGVRHGDESVSLQGELFMNIRHIAFGVGLVSFGLTAFGCSSSTKATGNADSGINGSGGGGGGGGASGTLPTVEITAPIDGASVSIAASPDVPVALTVTHFTLMDPARTDNSPCPKLSCGHLHLLVDDGDGNFTKCNDTGKPYNEAAVALTGNSVGLDYCPQMNGPHTIKAEIHNDDHSPVFGADGTTVITSNLIHITATGGLDGG